MPTNFTMTVYEEFTGKAEVNGFVFTYKGSHTDYDGWQTWAIQLPADWTPFGIFVDGSSKEDAIEKLKGVVDNIRWWNQKTDEEQERYISKIRLLDK